MIVSLKGNYKGFVWLDVQRPRGTSDNVFVNVHGMYGRSGDPGSRSWSLGRRILNDGLGNVVQFSSSREWPVYGDDYQARAAAFANKTFPQELADLKDTIDLLLDQSDQLFRIDKDDLRLNLIANSIGGTIVSMLADRFRYVDRIILCGVGTGRSTSRRPILSSCPPEEVLFKSAATFTGDVLLVQGSRDDVVPLSAQNRLLSAYANANRQKVVIDGADHTFATINGINGQLAQERFIDAILEFIRRTPTRSWSARQAVSHGL